MSGLAFCCSAVAGRAVTAPVVPSSVHFTFVEPRTVRGLALLRSNLSCKAFCFP